MCSIDKLNDKSSQKEFDKKVVSATQHLQAYVKHRLYIAESTKIIPKNMFKSNDIIDEAIAKFYEKGYNVDAEASEIKIGLFKIVDSDLDDLFKNESFHQNTFSTDTILKEELEGLEENYTVDEDFDFIMNDELSDISYCQDSKEKQIFIYDDNITEIQNSLNIPEVPSKRHKHLIGHYYTWLPLSVSAIVDLFVFGKLNFDNIADIKNTDTKRVERIMKLVVEDFKENLN